MKTGSNPDLVEPDTDLSADPLQEVAPADVATAEVVAEIPPPTSAAPATVSTSPTVATPAMVAGAGVAPLGGVRSIAKIASETNAQSGGIDADELATAEQVARETLADGLHDITGSAAEAIESFNAVYVPLIARNAILKNSDDPIVKDRAEKNLRSLYAQANMNAAGHGIELQQRSEQRMLTLYRAATSAAAAAVRKAVKIVTGI